ncbi:MULTISPECIES: ABC transporter permease [Actinomycetes]|uniref:ABC transporter permease subunit n=2 Tax=Actinomycetes TaxID=1760 RepID=A0ABP6M2G4_9MICC
MAVNTTPGAAEELTTPQEHVAPPPLPEQSAEERRTWRARGRLGMLLVIPGFAFITLFFVVPVFSMLAMSLYVRPEGAVPGEFVPGFNIATYAHVMTTYGDTFVRSFLFATVATVAALCIGYPMAYLVAVRLRGRHLLQGLLLVVIIAPFFSSFILRVQSWRFILSDESWVVGFLKAISVLPQDGRLTATALAVVAGMTYLYLPLMTLPIYANLERLDTRLIEVGGDLYAGGLQTFLRVTLPLSTPGVMAGTILTFIPASGDYVNAVMLGNNVDTTTVGQIIDSRFFHATDYPSAAALSAVLMAIILILVTLYVRRFGTKEIV